MGHRTRELPSSFDQLLRSYYGQLSPTALPTVEDVISAYYGTPHSPRKVRQRLIAPAISLSRDDGEVLSQAAKRRRPAQYVVQSSTTAGAFQEYVIGGSTEPAGDTGRWQDAGTGRDFAPASDFTPGGDAAPAPDSAPVVLPKGSPLPAKSVNPVDVVSAAQEAMVDLRRPLARLDDASAAPAAAFVAAQTHHLSDSAPAPRDAHHRPQADDNDFAADMEAILSGQKVFDPVSRQTVERDRLREAQAAQPPPAQDPDAMPAPDAARNTAIFDRIAQSMQFANAYDLGTVELENRFADFDRIADLQSKARETASDAKAGAGQPPVKARPIPEARVGSADFLEDLDAIHNQRSEAGGSSEPPTATAESIEEPGPPIAYSSSIADWSESFDRDAACPPSALLIPPAEADPAYSRPFYDAGEHALAGGDLYAGQLHVGKSPGVAFSYGELIAMADLYASADQMMGDGAAPLSLIKSLIDRNTRYYQTHKTTDSLDVSNAEWDKATGDRYLKLAEENYEHFSPNVIFTDGTARAANRHGTNKSAWEAHHRRAILEAQKLASASGGAGPAPIPEWPLIINAFGDHFLTDAFASGHLLNKEVMIAYFKQSFFSGSSLRDAGEDFFKRVAEKAFVGDVRRKFSVLETADYPVCVWGWCLMWHPNIDTTNAFRKLLLAAAKQEPDKIANVALKALHDRLNKEGLEVTNSAGDGTWVLKGDGYLLPTTGDTSKSLDIMRRAVRQSVDNVKDSVASAGNLAQAFEKVWKHVPQPTPASQKKIAQLVGEYTNPKSVVLSDAAAEIIRGQVDSLIKVLIQTKKLKYA